VICSGNVGGAPARKRRASELSVRGVFILLWLALCLDSNPFLVRNFLARVDAQGADSGSQAGPTDARKDDVIGWGATDVASAETPEPPATHSGPFHAGGRLQLRPAFWVEHPREDSLAQLRSTLMLWADLTLSSTALTFHLHAMVRGEYDALYYWKRDLDAATREAFHGRDLREFSRRSVRDRARLAEANFRSR
jgi:hypothetical protein